MKRIYAEYNDTDEKIIAEIDKFAKKIHISRNQLLIKAVDQFIHPSTQPSRELDQLRTDFEREKTEHVQTRTELEQARTDLEQLRTELVHSRSERDQFKSDFDKRWKEWNDQRTEISQLKRDHETTRSKCDQLSIAHERARTEIDQSKSDVLAAKKDSEKYQEALKVREDDIAYFKSHVAQLTQSISQLSLKPGEEEIKKKGWWRFWK